SRYLLVEMQVTPPVKRLDVQVDSTTLALALDLGGDTSQKDVFAFLPLRSYGFRFLLQADFVVPSSREARPRYTAHSGGLREEEDLGGAVDVDSAWNESLLHYIPELFVQTVEAAKALVLGNGGFPEEAVLLWLPCVPREAELQGLFQPCA
ncbi:hypothetical protein CYMTET_43588, partial [Cymbomonas tetramitiformis]